jgi:hypothetical protein
MCVDRRPFLADPIEASRCTADRMVARCHRAVVVGKRSNLLLCDRLAEQPRRSAFAFESAPVGAAFVDELLLRPRPRLLAPAGSDSAVAGGGLGGGAKRVAWVMLLLPSHAPLGSRC